MIVPWWGQGRQVFPGAWDSDVYLVKGAVFYSLIVCGPITFLPGPQFLFL